MIDKTLRNCSKTGLAMLLRGMAVAVMSAKVNGSDHMHYVSVITATNQPCGVGLPNAKLLKRINPDARLIAIVREPVRLATKCSTS